MVKAIVFIGYFHEIKTSGKFGTYILIWNGKELLVHCIGQSFEDV